MKNTRTPRADGKITHDEKEDYWMGNHKYTKKKNLKTSRGDYSEENMEEDKG